MSPPALETRPLCGATRRLHWQKPPGYAPELNPAEGVWNYLKNIEMKNLCCHNLQVVGDELREAIQRLRHKTNTIQSSTRHVLAGANIQIHRFGSVDKLDGRTSDSVRSRLKALGLRHNNGSKPTWEWSEGTTLLKNGNPSVPIASSAAVRLATSPVV